MKKFKGTFRSRRTCLNIMPSMILQNKQYQNILYRVEEKNAELV